MRSTLSVCAVLQPRTTAMHSECAFTVSKLVWYANDDLAACVNQEEKLPLYWPTAVWLPLQIKGFIKSYQNVGS
jgi:hypothetical protein